MSRADPVFFLTSLYFTHITFSPQAFFLENEEISTPPPCGLEYIYFMKIGQPKLSERETQEVGCLLQLSLGEVNLGVEGY